MDSWYRDYLVQATVDGFEHGEYVTSLKEARKSAAYLRRNGASDIQIWYQDHYEGLRFVEHPVIAGTI